MVKTFAVSTVKEQHRKDMDAIRAKLKEFDPRIVKQQCGFKRGRWDNFLLGLLDMELKAWEVTRMKFFLAKNAQLMKRVKSGREFRLLGDPLKPVVEINKTTNEI